MDKFDCRGTFRDFLQWISQTRCILSPCSVPRIKPTQCFIAAFFKEAHKLHITRSRPIKMSGAEHKSFVNIYLMLDDHQKADSGTFL